MTLKKSFEITGCLLLVSLLINLHLHTPFLQHQSGDQPAPLKNNNQWHYGKTNIYMSLIMTDTVTEIYFQQVLILTDTCLFVCHDRLFKRANLPNHTCMNQCKMELVLFKYLTELLNFSDTFVLLNEEMSCGMIQLISQLAL